MANSRANLSQFVPSGVNVTLNNVNKPKSFGDQLVNSAKQQVKTALLNAVDLLKKEIEKIIIKKINLEINHNTNLSNLKKDSEPTSVITGGSTVEMMPPLLDKNEYDAAVAKENLNYNEELKALDKLKEDLQKRLETILLGDYIEIKQKYKEYKSKRESRKKRTDLQKRLAKSEKKKQISRFLLSVVSTIIIRQITEILIQVISDNGNLQRLVDKTNDIIEAAVTLDAINQARISRNACINNINKQESKINSLLKLAKTINIVLTVLTIVLKILESIPTPGIIAKKIAILASKALYVVRGVQTALSIGISMLETGIDVLEDLKKQVRDLNQLIEDKTISLLTDSELADYLSQIRNSSEDPLNGTTGTNTQDLINQLYPSNSLNTLQPGDFGSYKGFRFVIKEENDPKFVVKGSKRHYAVAINTREVEQIKSDYSFTLDPQQLVDQLKLIIDQQDLQG